MEANYRVRRTAESSFINQRATKVNVLNRIDRTEHARCLWYAYGLIFM